MYLSLVRSYFHIAIFILLLICSESQSDDDPTGSKHVACEYFIQLCSMVICLVVIR